LKSWVNRRWKVKQAKARRYETAWDWYRSGDFYPRSPGELREAEFGPDAVVARLRQTCYVYLEDPPDPDWDGISK
jgi:hypothetical protein